MIYMTSKMSKADFSLIRLCGLCLESYLEMLKIYLGVFPGFVFASLGVSKGGQVNVAKIVQNALSPKPVRRDLADLSQKELRELFSRTNENFRKFKFVTICPNGQKILSEDKPTDLVGCTLTIEEFIMGERGRHRFAVGPPDITDGRI